MDMKINANGFHTSEITANGFHTSEITTNGYNTSEIDTRKSIKVALLGFPCDLGVVTEAIAAGGKRGPEAVRKKIGDTNNPWCYYRFGPIFNVEHGIDLTHIDLTDHGDVDISSDLNLNHKNLTEKVQVLCDQGYICIIVGGSRDQSYSNAKGLMNSRKCGDIGVVNIDAHMDVDEVRKKNFAHHGTPFRRLLEDKAFTGKFSQFASQGNQCDSNHVKYVKEKSGRIYWLSHLKKNGVTESFREVLNWFDTKDVFVSLDIDAIQGCVCPGGWSSVRGLTAEEVLSVALEAGRHSKTRVFDISEYNPEIEETRTGWLMKNLIYYFLMGVASRN
ncbi:formimidoylglutamase-like [Hydractinia symbiolongicarpus]|uniref:formimidoylglutamase-like n=1 Tax=Hydractinia symbiolongicarpus TaxID=13093 RepID=UPI00254F97A9|nr:formimidoylglutamase-like [Hydractinia symbiolongicarpus]